MQSMAVMGGAASNTQKTQARTSNVSCFMQLMKLMLEMCRYQILLQSKLLVTALIMWGLRGQRQTTLQWNVLGRVAGGCWVAQRSRQDQLQCLVSGVAGCTQRSDHVDFGDDVIHKLHKPLSQSKLFLGNQGDWSCSLPAHGTVFGREPLFRGKEKILSLFLLFDLSMQRLAL